MKLELNEKEVQTILDALQYKKLMGMRLTSHEKGLLTKTQNKIVSQIEEA
jgi:hypothetical protein